MTFSDASVEDPSITCDQQGKYELEVTAVSGSASVSDVVVIYVHDSANNQLLAHYDFDDAATSPDVLDVTGNGFDTTCTVSNPEVIDGYIAGSEAAVSMGTTPAKWLIPGTEPNAVVDSQDLTYGYTFSVWFRAPVDVVNFDRIAFLVDGRAELSVQNNKARWIKPYDAVFSTTLINDAQWHHFVGVYDPFNNYSGLYLDGVLETTSDTDIREFYFPISSSCIGGKPSSNQFAGDIDDVRFYNYPMTEEDIQALHVSQNPLYIDAGENGFVAVNEALALDGTVTGDYTSLVWTKVSGPGNAVFTDSGIEDPEVTFDHGGIYELQLEAVVGGSTISDTVTLYVDGTEYDQLMAHWDFEDLSSDPNAYDVTGHGFDGMCSISSATVIPGYIWGSSGAVSLGSSQATWDIAEPAGLDENINTLAFGCTLSTWMRNPVAGVNDWSRVLSIIPGEVDLFCRSDGTVGYYQYGGGRLFSTSNLNDNLWHHVVVTHDPVSDYSALYIDGVLENTGDCDFSEFSFTGIDSYIARNNSSNPALYSGDLDDIRVYNYPMDEADTLALFYDTVPMYVNAGSDADYYPDLAPTLDLNAVVVDHGLSSTLTWSVSDAPAGATVDFGDAGSAATTAVFSEEGTYELNVELVIGTDSISDTIVVTVIDPDCQDVISAELGYPADLNDDCYVDLDDLQIFVSVWLSQTDLVDFAGFAGYWGECNNPDDSSCNWPF